MTKPKKEIRLPVGVTPIGFSLEEAAKYVGVSPGMYLDMVKAGIMPGPKRFGARVVFSRQEVEDAFHRWDSPTGVIRD